VEHEAALAQLSIVETPSEKKGRRVSSVGARLEEPPPPPEVAAELTPIEKTKPKIEPEKEVANGPAKPAISRSGRARGRGRRRIPTKPTADGVNKPAGQPSETETASAPSEKPNEQPAAEPGARSTPAPRVTGRRTAISRRAVKPSPEAEVESGPRLIIETNDGTLIDRYMSSVRRVTVENGQVVVVGKDGKIERIPLANVLRMTISP
jgi:hypothetical protein